MGQRVNIQYSVEIKDLKDEVGRLLEGVHSALHGADTFLTEDVLYKKEMLSLKTLEDIDQIRLQLAKADFTLGDVAIIINGYINYKTQSAMPKQDAPEIPEMEDEDPLNVSEIDVEAEIENFKKTTGAHEVSTER
jgi:hypothetical protein